MGGIYKILNIKTNDFYIGSTIDFAKRQRVHLSKLRKNKHSNSHLQYSYNKHGENSFKFIIIHYANNESELPDLESYYINLLNPKYNKTKTTSRPNFYDEKGRSINRTELFVKKTKEELSQKMKIICNTNEFKEKMSIANKKYYSSLSDEEKIKRNKHKIGRIFTSETREKLSKKAKSRVWSEEVKKKISETLKSKKQQLQ